jgi:hypothetical protein
VQALARRARVARLQHAKRRKVALAHKQRRSLQSHAVLWRCWPLLVLVALVRCIQHCCCVGGGSGWWWVQRASAMRSTSSTLPRPSAQQ